jgi:hypothetical protein
VGGEHAHEQDLEPEADPRYRDDLVLAQLDALGLAQFVPQRGAVERHALRLDVVHPVDRGGVPVDVQIRVVRVLGRGRQQATGGLVPVGHAPAVRKHCGHDPDPSQYL